MKSLFIGFLFLWCLNTNAQIITTVAGNGTYGYSGDGGIAISAQMACQIGVVADNLGSFFASIGGEFQFS
jgi:hypothetical protein